MVNGKYPAGLFSCPEIRRCGYAVQKSKRGRTVLVHYPVQNPRTEGEVQTMPKKPQRGCFQPGCSKRAVEGSIYCEEHKKLNDQKYNQYERAPDVHKKYGRAWKRIRDRYVMTHPLCEKCLEEGILTPVAEVHHITPVSQGGRHSDDNLMSLCHRHHQLIHMYELGDRQQRD